MKTFICRCYQNDRRDSIKANSRKICVEILEKKLGRPICQYHFFSAGGFHYLWYNIVGGK